MRLCVMHNLYFYNTLLEKIRFAIEKDQFDELYVKFAPVLDKRI